MGKDKKKKAADPGPGFEFKESEEEAKTPPKPNNPAPAEKSKNEEAERPRQEETPGEQGSPPATEMAKNEEAERTEPEADAPAKTGPAPADAVAALEREYPELRLLKLTVERGEQAGKILRMVNKASSKALAGFVQVAAQLRNIETQYVTMKDGIKECRHVVRLSDKDRENILADWKRYRAESLAAMAVEFKKERDALALLYDDRERRMNALLDKAEKRQQDYEGRTEALIGKMEKLSDTITEKQKRGIHTLDWVERQSRYHIAAIALVWLTTMALIVILRLIK